jgi:nucleoside-diphosphate-sugar epimerase
MNILVLGGTKYAGIHLVNELISAGYDVTIATRGKTPDNFHDKVGRKVIERKNADSLFAAFNDEFYDVVIDNLAYCSNDVCYLLDSIHTKKYIMTSTISVYSDFHMNMQEIEVDTRNALLKWCGHDEYTYGEAKRQAESALIQAYPSLPSVAVRFPWIFGKDDYTKRLFFYVEHIFNAKSMNIDNYDARLSFINSHEAGRFLAWCAGSPVLGVMNASSCGTISLEEIIDYVEKRIGKKAIIDVQGESAPLNGAPSFSLDTTTAQSAGFSFQNISEWVYPMIDYWVDTLNIA